MGAMFLNLIDSISLAEAFELYTKGEDLANYRIAFRSSDNEYFAKNGPANFAGADLAYANLEGADLSSFKFNGADLTGAKMNYAVAEKADFSGAVMTSVSAVSAVFNNAIFHNTIAYDVEDKLNFASAHIEGASFRNVNFAGAIFSDAILTASAFTNVNLTKGNLNGAQFSFAIVDQCVFEKADLKYINFSESLIRASDFSKANLQGATFVGSDIEKTVFDFATLKNVDFKENKNINTASFNQTDLTLEDLKRLPLTEEQKKNARYSAYSILFALLDNSKVHT